jgi:hypothetical protein
MRLTAVCLLATLSVACGSREDDATIDAQLKPYVAEVLSWSGEALSSSIESVRFGKPPNGWAASCHRERQLPIPFTRWIVVDKAVWSLLNENNKLELIAHELGHCQWDWEHTSEGLMRDHLHAADVDARELFMAAYASR